MKHQPNDYPEFAVTRDRLYSYFSPPLARSTFYNLVNRGRIQPVSGVRGYYRLNESLRRMGMPAVKELPPETSHPPESSESPMALPSITKAPVMPVLDPLLLQGFLELKNYIRRSCRDEAWLRQPKRQSAGLIEEPLCGRLTFECNASD